VNGNRLTGLRRRPCMAGYGHAGEPHHGKEGQVGDSRDGPPVELMLIGCERDGYAARPVELAGSAVVHFRVVRAAARAGRISPTPHPERAKDR
jgi:hypothetical protein